MAALTCDICGGSLTMNESGEFAICESCGMKHDKRRVQAKVQEITGVVEVTKGEAEKERLIKNAETFINLGKIDEAEKIYAQLVKEYPNEWMGWAGNAYIQLLHFPCSFSHTDINDFMGEMPNIPEKELFWIKNPYNREFYEFVETFTTGYEYSYKQFEYYCGIASKLEFDDFQRYIEAKWKQHDDRHNQFVVNLQNMVNCGTPCFDEILIFFAEDAFIPSKLREIITQLRENAAEVNTALEKNKNKYENFNSLGKTDFRFDYDGIRKIERVAFLSSSQAVLLGHFWQGEYGNSSDGMILTFDKIYTTAELIATLTQPTIEEIEAPKLKEAKQLILSMRYDKSVLQKILKKYTNRDLDKEEDSRFYRNYSYEIKDINMQCISYQITYYSTTPYDNKQRQGYTSANFNSQINFDEIIVTLRQFSCKCRFCGGEFKGIFKKVCSKCGKQKDY